MLGLKYFIKKSIDQSIKVTNNISTFLHIFFILFSSSLMYFNYYLKI